MPGWRRKPHQNGTRSAMVALAANRQPSTVKGRIEIRPVKRTYYARLQLGRDYQIGLGPVDIYHPVWLLDCVLGRASELTLNELFAALAANKSMRTEIKAGRPRKRSRI